MSNYKNQLKAFVIAQLTKKKWQVGDDCTLGEIFKHLNTYAKQNHEGPGKCKDQELQWHKDFCDHLDIGTSGSLDILADRLKKYFNGKKNQDNNKKEKKGKTIGLGKTIGKKTTDKSDKSKSKKSGMHTLKNNVSAIEAVDVLDIKVGDICRFKNGDEKELKKTESGDYRWSKCN